MARPLPRIETINEQARLLVDGRPFLILGVQWDCDSCFSAAEMNPLFPHAARLGCNTVTLPTYWREIEPEPGRYDFSMLDERLRVARANNLRIIPLWFATWKNACPFYAPEYIRNDPVTYRRAVDRDGKPTVSLCPSSEVTWQRDRDALVAMMRHLHAVDSERTVIMVQIENEAGILGSDRCYCPDCQARFESGGWEAQFGINAAEFFSAASIAGYIDRLAGEAKAVYPLPTYVNVWMAPALGGTPGKDYPSGGAVQPVLDFYRQQCRHLDLVAPDIYSPSRRDFHDLCQRYCANGNPLFIAEHSSSVNGRAERNVFYAIGEFGALGFDPWAIDSPFPDRYSPPLVDSAGGEWGPQAAWLRDSYHAIGMAVEPIVDAQGSSRMFTFVQEAMEGGAAWAAEGCDVFIRYPTPEGMGRGIVIQLSAGEFIALGAGFEISFRMPRPECHPAPVKSAEWGYFKGDKWVSLHPMRREHLESVGNPVEFLEPGVARILLDVHSR